MCTYLLNLIFLIYLFTYPFFNYHVFASIYYRSFFVCTSRNFDDCLTCTIFCIFKIPSYRLSFLDRVYKYVLLLLVVPSHYMWLMFVIVIFVTKQICQVYSFSLYSTCFFYLFCLSISFWSFLPAIFVRSSVASYHFYSFITSSFLASVYASFHQTIILSPTISTEHRLFLYIRISFL